MTPLDQAYRYAEIAWPVFPCHWAGDRRKRPLIQHGLHGATRDETQIRDWWRRWPTALIGVPTGRITGFVALDVDVRAGVNGFDTLADVGIAVLPNTPMVHTASGGLHLYFRPPERTEIRNTAGGRGSGIGLGLDWRGEGGYVIVPSPGSGYRWDPHWNLDAAALAPIPTLLLPRVPERPGVNAAVARAAGLSPYAETALDSACRRIIEAPDGQQEQTVNAECFAIGTLVGASAIPADFAQRALIWASRKLRDYDHRRRWRAAEIEAKVNRAFNDGTRQPRQARGG